MGNLCIKLGLKKKSKPFKWPKPPPQSLDPEYQRYKKYLSEPHYLRKHYYNAESYLNQGKLPASLFHGPVEVINENIRETVEFPDRIEEAENRYTHWRLVFIKKFDQSIGTNDQGELISNIKVVADYRKFEFGSVKSFKIQDLELVTAFPYC